MLSIDMKKYTSMLDAIEGWYHPYDFNVTVNIIDHVINKNYKSGEKVKFCEIGVFHGKSFVPVCEYFYDRIDTFYCCDIFSPIDQLEVFRQHLAHFLRPDFDNKVEIIREDSLKLHNHLPEGSDMEKFIFCSVDGYHAYEHTYSDLSFCAKRLVPGGVIVLDDVFHIRWPEVSDALYDFLNDNKHLKMIYSLRNRVVLSEDLEIMNAVFDDTTMFQQRIKGHPMNIARYIED